MRPKNRGSEGPIKAPALNITLFSGATLGIGAIVTFWQDLFGGLFGYQPATNPGPAAAIFVSLVAAIGLIVAGDLLARGVASSRVGDSAVTPKDWKATIVKSGADDTGYTVAAARVASAGIEFLIVKEGESPTWRTAGKEINQIKLQIP